MLKRCSWHEQQKTIFVQKRKRKDTTSAFRYRISLFISTIIAILLYFRLFFCFVVFGFVFFVDVVGFVFGRQPIEQNVDTCLCVVERF